MATTTIALEWLPTVWGYRASASTTDPVHWYRTDSWSDGRLQRTDLGDGNPVTDLQVPLDGQESTYICVDATGETTVTVTPPMAVKPVLGCPNRPDLPAAEIVVQTSREYEVEGRSYIYEVLDRNVPLVEPEPPIDRSGEMVWRLEHPAGAPFPNVTLRHVRGLLRTGEPLLLRSTCHERVDTLAFIPLRFRESAIGENNEHGPNRTMTVEWRAVEPLWGDNIVVAARVWGLVPWEFPTWDDVQAVPDWDTLAYGGVT